MKKNPLLAAALSVMAALALAACSKTETIDAGTPPPVVPTPILTQQPPAPAPQPQAGAVSANEFRAFSSAEAPAGAKTPTPAADPMAKEFASLGSDKKKPATSNDSTGGLPPGVAKGPAIQPPPPAPSGEPIAY